MRPCAATAVFRICLQIVDGAVQPDEDLRALGFDRAGGRHDVAAVERGEEVRRGHAQGCEAVIGELDEDPFRLLADDVHLLDARHVQQALAQDLRIADEVPMRLALRLQRVERKGHIGIFVVHHRTDDATRQVRRLVAEFLPRLIELLGDIGGRRAVAQDHRGERQARSRKGLGPVIPAELLHPLLQPFGDQLFHLLCRRPRPGRDDGHLLDGERGIFRPAQHQERHDAGDGNRHEQEQRDGALAYGESGEIEAAHCRAHAVDGHARCGLAPRESHVLAFVQQMRTERNDAIARLEFADDRSRFVAETGDLHGTPRDPRRFPFDQPYAGALARIEDRADRYLQRRRRTGRPRSGWRWSSPAARLPDDPPARTEPRTSESDGLRRPTTGEVSRSPSARFHTRSRGQWIQSPGAGFREAR